MKPITIEEQEAARRIRNAENAAREAEARVAIKHVPGAKVVVDLTGRVTGIAYPAGAKGDWPPARLDADGTAKPLTRIVSHAREGDVVGPGRPLVDPEHEDESGKRTPLVDPVIDHDVAAGTLVALREHGPFADARAEVERLVALGDLGAIVEMLVGYQEIAIGADARADSERQRRCEATARAKAAEGKLAKATAAVAELHRRLARGDHGSVKANLDCAVDAIGCLREARGKAEREADAAEKRADSAEARLAVTEANAINAAHWSRVDARRARRWEAFARRLWAARLESEDTAAAAAIHAEHDCGACGKHLGHARHCPCWFGSHRGKPGAGTLVNRSKGDGR